MDWIFAHFSVIVQPLPTVPADASHLNTILNLVYGITSAIALLIIVLAGFRYIISQGNSNELTIAKNAIIYSLIGLVVVTTAFAIVKFVVRGIG